MGDALKQDTRIGEFTTPLGKDVLVLVRFDGTESLSELFEYRIEDSLGQWPLAGHRSLHLLSGSSTPSESTSAR